MNAPFPLPATASPLLAVQGLSFEAEGRRLLDGVSFALPAGGITALIGPNGAGKSLLLRLCHGLIASSAGTVSWATERRTTPHLLVFQRPVMLRRSVRANLLHALRATGVSDAAARAGVALERFGMTTIADRPARLLSGGEQQRLAIARAWALSPACLLMDEPTSQLDPGATRQIETLIRDLAAEGMTVLMSTHDLGQARRLSSRLLFLHAGRLLEDRPTAAFFDAPASEPGRAFIAGDLLW